jgi:hypothetical protein
MNGLRRFASRLKGASAFARADQVRAPICRSFLFSRCWVPRTTRSYRRDAPYARFFRTTCIASSVETCSVQ